MGTQIEKRGERLGLRRSLNLAHTKFVVSLRQSPSLFCTELK